MNLSIPAQILYGLVMGAAEVLPVSSRAHGQMLAKLLGDSASPLCMLFLHLGVVLALYTASRETITRILRALALARIPKRKRKRPLDTVSLMDFRLLRTMMIPAVLLTLLYSKLRGLDSNLLIVSAFVFFNGLLLYIPQFFPGCNKDARTLSPLEGLIMGAGMGIGVFPGVSGMGACVCAGLICGVERRYLVNMSLLTNLAVLLTLTVHDVLTLVSIGVGVLSFAQIAGCLAVGLAAFAGCLLAVRIVRKIADFTNFAYYCWGVALLVFILNLLA